MKIAVCVHLYHTDMWEKIQKYLENIPFPYELYVNFPLNEKDGIPQDFNWEVYLNLYDDLKSKLKHSSEILLQHYLKYGKLEKRHYRKDYFDAEQKILKYKSDTKFIFTKNIGMDIGGFLQTYSHINSDIDLILKIHTKKSLGSFEDKSFDVDRYGYNKAKIYGEEWFNELMNGVLGNPKMVESIVNKFKNDVNCGMVGYKKYNNHKKNGSFIKPLLDYFSLKININESYFVGGTIFWVRNDILKKYLNDNNLKHIISLLPPKYSYEPSYPHAMERMFGYFVYDQKQELMVID
jgi:lipopolysaccharide biosynthesis protein